MKIVFFLSRVPWPLDKGDKLRAFYQMKELAKSHTIYLIALSDTKIHNEAKSALEKFCKEVYFFRLNRILQLINIKLSFLTRKPLQIAYFFDAIIRRKTDKIIQKIAPDIVFFQLVRTAEYAKNIHFPKIIDYQDTLSLGLLRRIERIKGIWKIVLKIEEKRLRKYEELSFENFDEHLLITEADRTYFPHSNSGSIKIIPNGIDSEKFKSKNTTKEYDIIFAGNLNYPPNVDASLLLINRILPKIRKKLPDVKLILAGANPAAVIRKHASDHITITGWVDDISKVYDQSRVFVAPMQIGTGLQNKLLEAMSMKLPCITSPLANQALGAKAGEEILIADDADRFAENIVNLLNNNTLYQMIATQGNDFIKSNYTWVSVGKQLEAIFKSIQK